MGIGHGILAGAAAGAAGTTTLNAVTYLDMTVRGRPASSTPEKTVEVIAQDAGIDIPGDEQTRQNRVQGLGPLTGIAAGVGVGAAIGIARALGVRTGVLITAVAAAAGAMAASDVPMTKLGVTDPRTWGAKGWLSDAIPHLAYGLVTAAVLIGLDRDRVRRRNRF